MNIKKILKDLSTKGFFLERGFIGKDKIKSLLPLLQKEMSTKENVWSDDLGSDLRIFGIDMLDSEFKKIFDHRALNEIYSKYIGGAEKHSFVMANHVQFKEKNKGSGGGWHRDTFFSRQLKFIVYLTDVSDENGPFEYLQKSHRKSHKIKDLMLRFRQDNIRRYVDKDFQNSIKMLGNAGDLIIADTSGIHRGSPIREGERIALTNYLSHRPFSKSVEDQLPLSE